MKVHEPFPYLRFKGWQGDSHSQEEIAVEPFEHKIKIGERFYYDDDNKMERYQDHSCGEGFPVINEIVEQC